MIHWCRCVRFVKVRVYAFLLILFSQCLCVSVVKHWLRKVHHRDTESTEKDSDQDITDYAAVYPLGLAK